MSSVGVMAISHRLHADRGFEVATVDVREQLGRLLSWSSGPQAWDSSGGHSGHDWRDLKDSEEVRLPWFAGRLPMEGEGEADAKDSARFWLGRPDGCSRS